MPQPQGQFPPSDSDVPTALPPARFEDARGRELSIRRFGAGPVDDEFEALVDFFEEFPASDRSLGVPPMGEVRIRQWLGRITEDVCLVTWRDEQPAGLAVLVAADGATYELAVFVGPTFQHAGVGTHLLGSLLADGNDQGVERVWLLVEHENRAAVNLYLDFGFTVERHRGMALEMLLEMD